MFGITDLGTYVLGVIFIVLLPGPNSLYVLSVAGRRGVRAGYAGACGVFLGDTILMLLTAAGAASLLKAAPALFLLIKSVGAAYLAWIGLQLLRSAWQQWRAVGGAQAAPEPQQDASRPFHRALVISLLNPKAILFFLSFFVQNAGGRFQTAPEDGAPITLSPGDRLVIGTTVWRFDRS